MNDQSRQIEVYSGLGQVTGGSGLGQVTGGSFGQGFGCSQLLPYYCTPSSPRLPRDYELVIEKVRSEIVLDYGAKLRLLIADPIGGIDLREAIQKLKEAFLKAR